MIKGSSGIRKEDIINRRMFIIGAAKVVIFTGIIVRLFSLQINETKKYLTLSDKKNPKVCFIPTASGDDESYRRRFYSSYKKLNCETSHLSLFWPPEGDLREFVLDKDIFYVGGGNTRNLMLLRKEWSLDVYLEEAWNKGAIMAGLSAGSICWFEKGLTDSVTGKLLPLDCLGFLPNSNCPHFDTESQRRPEYHKAILDGSLMEGIACDDGVAAHFIDGKH